MLNNLTDVSMHVWLMEAVNSVERRINKLSETQTGVRTAAALKTIGQCPIRVKAACYLQTMRLQRELVKHEY
ncbi:MAG: hypothetical protein QXG97_04990 [Nitrososphaerota archaeon]